MPIFKSKPIDKYINGTSQVVSEITVITDNEYTTNGELVILAKDTPECTITLDHNTTNYLTIKSLTNTLIKSEKNIDDEYTEIFLNRGACVELRFIIDGWYIMSSDGLKNS